MKKIIAVILALLITLAASACGGNETETMAEAALSQNAISLKMGESVAISVVNYADSVKWSSNNQSVAHVSQSGVVTAVSIGHAAITAELVDGSTMTCIADVKPGESSIEKIVVTSLYSDASDITVNYENGNTVSLKATCSPDINEPLYWSSSDALLASVDGSGLVTVYGNGIVEIKAMALNGISGSCKVRIKNVPAGVQPVVMPQTNTEVDIPVIDDETLSESAKRFTSPVPVTSPSAKTSVIVSDKNVYLNVGESFTLTYATGNTDAASVEWSSSDKRVAIVKDGRIVAVGEGRATISAVTKDCAVANCYVAVGEEEIEAMKKEVSESKK